MHTIPDRSFPVQNALRSLALTGLGLFAAATRAADAAADNPYGLDALWNGGDIVARSTLVILAIMSVGSWFIIVTRLLAQRKLARDQRAAQALWLEGGLTENLKALPSSSAYHLLARSGLDAVARHAAVARQVDLNSWLAAALQRSVDKIQARLQEGLTFLATVGSTAPFVGLFGTVWGIYHALTAIGIAGQASIDKVAGPVGEALIMTAIGLLVAVPAVLGYNWLIRRNKAILSQVHDFGSDLHEALLGDVTLPTGVTAPASVGLHAVSETATGRALQPALAAG